MHLAALAGCASKLLESLSAFGLDHIHWVPIGPNRKHTHFRPCWRRAGCYEATFQKARLKFARVEPGPRKKIKNISAFIMSQHGRSFTSPEKILIKMRAKTVGNGIADCRGEF